MVCETEAKVSSRQRGQLGEMVKACEKRTTLGRGPGDKSAKMPVVRVNYLSVNSQET